MVTHLQLPKAVLRVQLLESRTGNDRILNSAPSYYQYRNRDVEYPDFF